MNGQRERWEAVYIASLLFVIPSKVGRLLGTSLGGAYCCRALQIDAYDLHLSPLRGRALLEWKPQQFTQTVARPTSFIT